MDQQEIFTYLMEIVRDKTGQDKIDIKLDSTPLKAYGIDSLCMMQMVAAIEERYGIEIDEMEVFNIDTFLTFTDLVSSKYEFARAHSFCDRSVSNG